MGGGALAWALAGALPVEGLLPGSVLIEESTPTAVKASLLGSQYGLRPDLAAATLFLSTLLSLGTLSLS